MLDEGYLKRRIVYLEEAKNGNLVKKDFSFFNNSTISLKSGRSFGFNVQQVVIIV